MFSEVRSTCPFDDQYGKVEISIENKEGSLAIAIETARLRIFSVNTDQYTTFLIDLYGNEAVNRLVGSGATLKSHLVVEKIERWKKRWSENNPFSGYVVVEKETGEFVGQIILKPVKDKAAGAGKFVEGVAEIGYLSVQKHWGKRFGQEYTHAMVHHLIPQLIDSGYKVQGHRITLVMATAREDNIASNCVLRKFMAHTGTKERYGGVREWYEHQFVAL